MKVITLITRMIRGGAQRIALETAAELNRRGFEAPLWCGAETGPEGSLLEEAAARGIPIRIFPHVVRRVNPLADGLAWLDLRRALAEERPDWLHTHSSKAGILGREAARAARLPRVAHTVHGWGFTPGTGPLAHALYVALERRGARGNARMRREILFVSETDREEGIRLGIVEPGAGILLPIGIDLSPYRDHREMGAARSRVRAEAGCAPDSILGGFVGRLSPQKDPEAVLEVARLLAGEFPRLRWLIVGDGPLGPRLRALADRDERLRGRIHWAGLRASTAPDLAAIDFLLLPSLWEGSPLTVVEAMAAGSPIVASDLPGIRTLLTGAGEFGLLAAPGDRQSFAAGVRALLGDRAQAEARAVSARRHALAHFDRESMLAPLIALYESARGDGRPIESA